QAHAAGLEAVDQAFADEHVLRADPNLQSGDGRIRPLRELDDEILDSADFRPGRIQHRAAQQLRDHEPPVVSVARRLLHAAVPTSITHFLIPSPPFRPNYPRQCSSASRASGPSHTSRAKTDTY